MLKIPIQLYGLEGRYATAIYTAAAKKNQIDAVDKDFQNILVGYFIVFLDKRRFKLK